MKKTGSKALSDPFAFSLEDYLALGEEQQWALTQKLYERYTDWIRQQFQKTGAALLVLCDRKVIYSSSDRYDFQADKVVEQAQQQRKKPCFILTHPVLVEEMATWSDLGRGDHYPTVELFYSVAEKRRSKKIAPSPWVGNGVKLGIRLRVPIAVSLGLVQVGVNSSSVALPS